MTSALAAISRVDAPSKERSEKRSMAAATIRSRVASADGRVVRTLGAMELVAMPRYLIR